VCADTHATGSRSNQTAMPVPLSRAYKPSIVHVERDESRESAIADEQTVKKSFLRTRCGRDEQTLAFANSSLAELERTHILARAFLSENSGTSSALKILSKSNRFFVIHSSCAL